MASQADESLHRHYAHTDSCKDLRWTAKECYQFMYDKPWKAANDFYLDLVNGGSSLADLFGYKNEDAVVGRTNEYAPEKSLPDRKSGRWDRVTFKIVLSYHGEYFDGWQKQPGLNTVQGLVEKSIGTFVDDRKAQEMKDKGVPVQAMAVVAGRTDKGVTALNQVSSFYTWRTDVITEDIKNAINFAAPGKLRVVSVSQVVPLIKILGFSCFSSKFCAKWRRYLYIFPLGEGDCSVQSNGREKTENMCFDGSQNCKRVEMAEDSPVERAKDHPDEKDEFDGVKKPTSFSIRKANQRLQKLEGKLLSYQMYTRDTKASRSIGPPTECFVYHARADEARVSCSNKVTTDHADDVRVMCVELVANRFLRRMVRVLVSTVVREAAAGSEDDALLKLMDATCRRATAPPAPPDGLCLVDVGYSDFDRQKCFIQ